MHCAGALGVRHGDAIINVMARRTARAFARTSATPGGDPDRTRRYRLTRLQSFHAHAARGRAPTQCVKFALRRTDRGRVQDTFAVRGAWLAGTFSASERARMRTAASSTARPNDCVREGAGLGDCLRHVCGEIRRPRAYRVGCTSRMLSSFSVSFGASPSEIGLIAVVVLRSAL